MQLPPYAETLGLVAGAGDTLVMPFAPDLIGAPERLHGGTIAGLLEIVSLRAVLAAAPPGTRPKPINVTVDYLRAGLMQDTHARATIVRLGRRVANVRAECWQEGPDRPIAAARMNILLDTV
ncbi:MAG: PaaI family thioesterase [Sphingomonadaceae bacterium]